MKMTARDLLGRVLMTLTAAEVGVIPFLVDVSPSHIFNAAWPAHARLHGMWLLVTGGLLSLVALYLIWFQRNNRRAAVTMAGVLLGAILSGFFTAVATVSLYGGSIVVDAASAAGLPDGNMTGGIPANVRIFAVALVALVIGLVLAGGAARAAARTSSS
jgi:hypothetical protein